VPWLTPETLPDDRTCRPVLIPSTSDWLAIVSGALTELTKRYNWEKQGAVTVDEAVTAMQEMVATYYAGCMQCEVPGGYLVTRINANGNVETLGTDGLWHEGSGDYAYPLPVAREGGTTQDQNCLAAANATNVLKLTYEELSDLWNSHVEEAEALTDLVLFIIGLLGSEFAPLTFAVVAFFAAVFHYLYDAIEFIGADSWDSTFDAAMQCMLYECASNDAGVVTFDWDCFTGKLNSPIDVFDLDVNQQRLKLQVLYILTVLGGVGALNTAGSTTAITEADCTSCAGCTEFDFTIDEQGWLLVEPTTYSSGTGFVGEFNNSDSAGWAYIHYDFEAALVATVSLTVCTVPGSGDNNVIAWYAYLSGELVGSGSVANEGGCPSGVPFTVGVTCDQLYLNVNTGTTESNPVISSAEICFG